MKDLFKKSKTLKPKIMKNIWRFVKSFEKVGKRFLHGYTRELTHPIPGKIPNFVSAEEAVSVVKSGKLHG